MNKILDKKSSFNIGAFILYTVEENVITVEEGIIISVLAETHIIERLMLICQTMNTHHIDDHPKSLQFSISPDDCKSIQGWMCQPLAKSSSVNKKSIIIIPSYNATWFHTYYIVCLKYASTQSLFGKLDDR
jgi:hypothetical protein